MNASGSPWEPPGAAPRGDAPRRLPVDAERKLRPRLPGQATNTSDPVRVTATRWPLATGFGPADVPFPEPATGADEPDAKSIVRRIVMAAVSTSTTRPRAAFAATTWMPSGDGTRSQPAHESAAPANAGRSMHTAHPCADCRAWMNMWSGPR